MKTSDLISVLAADAGTPPARPAPALVAGVVLSAVAAAAAFFLWLHPRPDVAQAAGTARFLFKFVETLLIAGAAGLAAMAIGRPGASSAAAVRAALIAGGVLLIAIAAELVTTPPGQWLPRLVGHNALFCLVMTPALSAAPLAILLTALRRMAPASPARLGFAAGVLAGAIGATFYALHCPDDSPLFLAVWYLAAILGVGGAGAAIGARVLRW